MNDDSYICHVIIPSKDHRKSKVFFERVFGWEIEKQPGTTSLGILPPSRKGVSAELNSKESTVVPSIHTSNIEAKLELIEKYGGKKLKPKTPIGRRGEHGFFALFLDPNGNRMCLYSEDRNREKPQKSREGMKTFGSMSSTGSNSTSHHLLLNV